MTPTSLKGSKTFVNDEYITQGLIIQEMRQASRRYGIPIVTITQNNRSAENFQMEMSNNLIGDSIKKIRYSDTIVMIRQRADLDIFNTQVSGDVNSNNAVGISDSSSDFLQYIIPFEAKITKAKDGSKGESKFHIFNRQNLRICESVSEMMDDCKSCTKKSNDLLNELSIIGLNNGMDTEISYDDDDPFENLII